MLRCYVQTYKNGLVNTWQYAWKSWWFNHGCFFRQTRTTNWNDLDDQSSLEVTRNACRSEAEITHISWIYPRAPGCNRHHQDCYIFSREPQTKPSFATITGWGIDPTSIHVSYSQRSISWRPTMTRIPPPNFLGKAPSPRYRVFGPNTSHQKHLDPTLWGPAIRFLTSQFLSKKNDGMEPETAWNYIQGSCHSKMFIDKKNTRKAQDFGSMRTIKFQMLPWNYIDGRTSAPVEFDETLFNSSTGKNKSLIFCISTGSPRLFFYTNPCRCVDLTFKLHNQLPVLILTHVLAWKISTLWIKLDLNPPWMALLYRGRGVPFCRGNFKGDGFDVIIWWRKPII